MRCKGVKQQGYWKGFPCAIHALPGRDFCANHLPEVLAARGKKVVTGPSKRKSKEMNARKTD